MPVYCSFSELFKRLAVCHVQCLAFSERNPERLVSNFRSLSIDGQHFSRFGRISLRLLHVLRRGFKYGKGPDGIPGAASIIGKARRDGTSVRYEMIMSAMHIHLT